jgi:hypothetical protein
LRTAAWAAFTDPDDVVVVLAELEVPGCVGEPEEHPAMVAVAATAATPASVFLNVVMVRLAVGVTFPLLSSVGSVGKCRIAGGLPNVRALPQNWMMNGQRHPERHPPRPDGRFLEHFCA